MASKAAVVTVHWGNDVDVSIRLTPANWARVRSGKPLHLRGKGYHYDGELFRDYWSFEGGLEGTLVVTYGEEDPGTGFDGRLADARIEEIVVRTTKKQKASPRKRRVVR
jgi:hypothetical protein